MKYTLTLTLLSLAFAQAAKANETDTDFNGFTLSGGFTRVSINDDDDYTDETKGNGYVFTADYDLNKIVGFTGGFSKDSLDTDIAGLDADTTRIFVGSNLGYRFEFGDFAVKPYGAAGYNWLNTKASYANTSDSSRDSDVYLGLGVKLAYQSIQATLEVDATPVGSDSDSYYGQSRFTLGYRF